MTTLPRCSALSRSAQLRRGPAEIGRPLGITIVGGLLGRQVLTLYTTPVIYLLLDRLHRRFGGRRKAETDADAISGPLSGAPDSLMLTEPRSVR